MANRNNRNGNGNGKSRNLPTLSSRGNIGTQLTRPLWYGGPDPITLNRMEALVQNVETLSRERTSRLGRIDPRRDLDEECGYPHSMSVEEYAELIRKEPAAALVASIYSLESWKTQPKIYDSDDPKNVTPFMEAIDTLPSMLGIEPSYHAEDAGNVIWPFLLNADILTGWGRYGIILIGTNDKTDLSEPLEPMKAGRKLTFLQAFPEHLARISSFENDKKSSRYGMPNNYQVTFSDVERNDGLTNSTEPYTTEYVHWSRVVHITDTWHAAFSSRNFAIPRCEPVLHPLLDIRKVRGSSAEMYYKAAFLGLHFGTHPQLGPDVEVNKAELQDMYEEYINGLQRAIWTQGMFVDPLAPQATDPAPYLDVQLTAISIIMRIPKRVLMGSERGELSSSDDRKDHNHKLINRQVLHNGPKVTVPLFNRFINLGILPQPKKPGYKLWWPDLASLTEAEKAEVLLKRTQAYGTMVSQGVESVIPPRHYMVNFDGMEEEEADQIIEALEKAREGQGETAAPLLGLVGGVDAMLSMFDKFKMGALSEETLKQLLMLFYKVDEAKAEEIIADGLPEPPPGAPGDPKMLPPVPPLKGPKAIPGIPPSKTKVVQNWLTINKVPSIAATAETIYSLMDDVTKAEAREIARTIKGGYLNDIGVNKIAKMLEKELGLDTNQALVVARTESARMRADDFVTSAAEEGTKKLTFRKSEDACPICQRLDGKKFSINTAMGLLPIHPNCNCAWEDPLTQNVFCPTGEGGGIDPTCSSGGSGEDPKDSYSCKECSSIAITRLTGRKVPDILRTAIDTVIEIEKSYGKADMSLTREWRGKTVGEFANALSEKKIKGRIGVVNVAANKELGETIGHIMPFLGGRLENIIGYHNYPISFVASWEAGKTPKKVKDSTNNIDTYDDFIDNVFCPTGEGGGIDPTCSVGGSGGGIIGAKEVKQWAEGWIEEHYGKKPTDEMIKGTSKYRPDKPLVLYRAHTPGKDSSAYEAWSRDRSEAEEYASNYEGRVVIARRVHPSEIVADFSKIPGMEKLGEIVVANGKEAERVANLRGEKLEKGTRWSGKWKSIQKSIVLNVFCPTGPGGGVDPTCSAGGNKGDKQGALDKLKSLPSSDGGHFGPDKDQISMKAIGFKGAGSIYGLPTPEKVAKLTTIETLKPSQINYAQTTVIREAVEKKIRGTDTDAEKFGAIGRPLVIKTPEGSYHLQTGNHRAVTEFLLTGELEADVLTIEYQDPRTKKIDWKKPTKKITRNTLQWTEDQWEEWVNNVFCPTGIGGGVDPTCSPGGTSKGGLGSRLKKLVKEKAGSIMTTLQIQTSHIKEYLVFTGDPKLGGDVEMVATAIRTLAGADKDVSMAVAAAVVYGGAPVAKKVKKGLEYIDSKLYDRIADPEKAPTPKKKPPITKEATSPPKSKKGVHNPDVEEKDANGITKASRVGVPASSVPPPPKIGELPNLTKDERKVERTFRDAFNKNPDKIAGRFLEIVKKTTKEGDPPTFGTDDAKVLHPAWGKSGQPLTKRSQNRATLNNALHQVANAIAKRAFVKHLDTLQPGDEVLVTVGGVGAGKGYALKNVPAALEMKKRAKAVWDSAGDQNATENPWIQKELERRGLRGNYVYVHADPYSQWADPSRGVVKRAADPSDGRMVDSKVFADSYAIGAKNHQTFYELNRNNPNARFVFLSNIGKPVLIEGIPDSALKIDRKALAKFAVEAVEKSDAPAHIKRGATQGLRIWGIDG